MDTVRKWRRRFAAGRLAGLKDAPRSGRPPVFTATDRAEAVVLACALPAESGVPLSRWSCPELARERAARCQIAVSASTIRRWLAADVCADEKTSIQSRCRRHPTLPAGKPRAMRVEHDYRRGGALAYLAAWDVHRGRVTGRCEPTTGIAPFARLVKQVLTTEPHASADRVFWIVDNGSSHRGAASVERMAKAWPNAHLIHLPARASWLDQAEIYFSVVQRKVLTPNDFTSLDQLRDRLAAFEVHYNQIARPFNWTFTRADLNDLLHRIDAHTQQGPAPHPSRVISNPWRTYGRDPGSSPLIRRGWHRRWGR